MDTATHLRHARSESDALLAAYREAPDAPVATCPGWDRTALLRHVGEMHAWVRAQLAAGPSERVRFSAGERAPDGMGLADWYDGNATALLTELASMDLDGTWSTWTGPQPGTFFPRRVAQELTIHRRDADPAPVDPAVAVDGVDELLDLFLPRLPRDGLDGVRGSIHLHATDADGEWLVHLDPEGVVVERGHAKGDAALRGGAGDLLLWAWNRLPLDDRFQAFGDAALLDRWRTAFAV